MKVFLSVFRVFVDSGVHVEVVAIAYVAAVGSAIVDAPSSG